MSMTYDERSEFSRLKQADVDQGKRIAELLAEVERLRADLVRFKKAAADQLHFDMAAIVSGTPESRLKSERDTALAEVERMRAALSGSKAERMMPIFKLAKKVVLERLDRIRHARETSAMCDLYKAIVSASSTDSVCDTALPSTKGDE